MSEADKAFDKLGYEKMIERNEDMCNIIYTQRYFNHRHSRNRVIQFSSDIGLCIRERSGRGITILTREEISAILLKIMELEKEGWSFN